MMFDEDNPYTPPKSQGLGPIVADGNKGGIWRDRNLLMVRKGVELPDRCLKCDAPAEGYRFKRNLSWASPWWFLTLFLIGPLLFVIIYYCVRWTGEVSAGLCPVHRTKRRKFIAIGWITALLGIALMITAGPLVEARFMGIPILAGALLMIAGMLIGAIGAQVLVPNRIDKHFIWLKKVSPSYLAKLPDWTEEGVTL
jgi:hypothetical protein